VVVVDLALPGSHGLQLIKEIRSQQHPARIVVFTMYDESSFALRALRAGAHGYVTKHESSDCLLKAIRTVLNGDYAVSPEVSKMFFESSLNQPSSCVGPMDSLGDRELEVLQLMGSGIGTQQIAFQLSRSVKTIETYQARIKRKLRLKNSAELMREAVRWVEAQR
jgi:DNA-binding NarL/FixJ family response regulator